jgi:predicted acetyltransferase
MSLEVRTVTESEFPDWTRALDTGFLRPPVTPAEVVADRLARQGVGRTRGAFDDGRCVATFRSFAQELTVPGGAVVPADAISNVTVSPTHRRRGLLSRMMTADLAAAKERGDVVATLIAAEYPIYGRYGFGPAAGTAEWSVDVARAGLDPRWAGPADGGRIDLADGTEIRKIGPEFHDRFRATRPGAIDRDRGWWDRNTGQAPSAEPWKEPFYAVYRSATGEVEGITAYRSDDVWNDSKQPQNTASVLGLTALTPAAERALWHFLCSIDWITTVRSGARAVDDLLPQLLPDPRAARLVTQSDFLWLRVLDTVRALEARTYAVPATLVLEVHDRAGLADGRFRLAATPQGATCTPTGDAPDLSLDVRELGSLYLGEESAVRLRALGTVTEVKPGAAAKADALFRTPRRPWCPDVF